MGEGESGRGWSGVAQERRGVSGRGGAAGSRKSRQQGFKFTSRYNDIPNEAHLIRGLEYIISGGEEFSMGVVKTPYFTERCTSYGISLHIM